MKTQNEFLSRWTLLFVITLLWQIGGIVDLTHAAEKVANPLNVVLVMVDDFGYDCVGCYGGTSYDTPNIDKLAKEGILFNHCYVQPLCTPTRVQLMTGMSNIRNYTVFGELHPSQKTFGNIFRDAGFATGIFGKWQLGQEVSLPNHFGFDTYRLWQHTRRPPRYANPGLEFQGVAKDFSHGEYGPDLVQQEALEFIEKNKEKPFFLYYPMILTHSPFQPTPDSPEWDPTRTTEQYSKEKHFKEMVECMDKHVGALVKKIDDAGLREKTMVIVIGDNGTGTSISSMFRGKPVQGGKGKTTDAGMHSPLVVRLPGTIKPGSVCDDLVASTDFLPTICEAAGIKVPTDMAVDGVSFYPQLLGKTGNPREWIYCWYLGQRKEGLQTVCAFDKQFKLYDNGDFYHIEQDVLEASKIAAASFSPVQKQAAAKLQNVLDKYKDARPEWVTARVQPLKEETPAQQRRRLLLQE